MAGRLFEGRLGRMHRRPLAAAVALLMIAGGARAMSFAEAYQAALRNDATYQAAGHELRSAQYNVPIARSTLLPTVSFSAANSDVTGSRRFPNSLNQDVRVHLDYSTPQGSLAMRVPIFNYEAISRYRQAQAQSDTAESVFRTKGLDLIDRLGSAYLQVLLAEEGRQLAQTQVDSVTVQATQARERFQRGEGTRVDVAQAQSNLDVARTRVFEADELLDLSRRQLKRITGLNETQVARVPTDYLPAPLPQEGLADWLSLALRQNPSLQAREQALTAAKMAVQRNLAGHLPRLDLVASLSQSQNESISSLNQTSTLRSVGVQLSVPLYNGGGVDANVKQARADQSKAEEEIRIEREGIEIEVQRFYSVVANGAAKIGAFRQAAESAELVLKGSRRAMEAGLATNNDVADAQARYFSAQRDLAQARIEYLQSRLRLMLQAGVPMQDVVSDLDRALVAPPSTPTR